jgi:hypothetical protein
MTRYGCFEIQTQCLHCGQPLPVNAPMRKITCSACLEKNDLPSEHLSGFLNDFEQEYPGLLERQGRGGQMMSGRHKYTYSGHRLSPRCKSCSLSLPEVVPGTDGQITCSGCGSVFATYPVPDWLKRLTPSAIQIISPERESALATGPSNVQPDLQQSNAIMMSCPGCGGGLTVMATTERVSSCRYCQAQVFIPDELWKRLHPVKTTLEWFVRFEGATMGQLNRERRQREVEAERAESVGRSFIAPSGGGAGFRLSGRILVIVGIAVSIPGIVTVLSLLGVVSSGSIGVAITVGVLVGVFGSLFPVFLGTRVGPLRESKQAMIALAHTHGLEIHGEFETAYIGTARGKIQGREVTIDPSGDEAIEVDLNERAFYVKTDPNYPRPDEELHRFTTHDEVFDRLFPIRYAREDIVVSLEKSPSALAPLYWFMQRWGKRIARLSIDCDVEVHILPGGAESELMKYLSANDMEPLLYDTIALARALDAVALGQVPELPSTTGPTGT